MKKAILAICASVALACPAIAETAADKARAQAQAELVDILAEAIAIDSVCPALILHTEYIWITLNQVKVNFDELLPAAGAKSADYMDGFARLGIGPVCQLGVELYGPQGTKAANMLTVPK